MNGIKWTNTHQMLRPPALGVYCAQRLNDVWLSAAPRTVAYQAPLSVEVSRQEYWSALQSPTPGDLPDSGIEPVSLASPALASRFFTTTTSHFPLFEDQVFTSRQKMKKPDKPKRDNQGYWNWRFPMICRWWNLQRTRPMHSLSAPITF